MKANVYKQYGDAAIMSIVLEALPKVSELKSLNLNTDELNCLNYYSSRLLLKSLHHWPKLMKLFSLVVMTV